MSGPTLSDAIASLCQAALSYARVVSAGERREATDVLFKAARKYTHIRIRFDRVLDASIERQRAIVSPLAEQTDRHAGSAYELGRLDGLILARKHYEEVNDLIAHAQEPT